MHYVFRVATTLRPLLFRRAMQHQCVLSAGMSTKKERQLLSCMKLVNTANVNMKAASISYSTDQYRVLVFPTAPKIQINSKQQCQIVGSNVLILTFLSIGLDNGSMWQEAWKNRKSIYLTLRDIIQILSVEPNSGLKIELDQQYQSTCKRLTIQDLKDDKQISLKLENFGDYNQPSQSVLWDVKLAVPYTSYRPLLESMRSNIYYLSGLKSTIEIQKEEMINQIEKNPGVHPKFTKQTIPSDINFS